MLVQIPWIFIYRVKASPAIFMSYYLFCFVCFLLILQFYFSGASAPERFFFSFKYFFFLAILLRLIHFVSPPYLDDDVFRYHWEGKLVHHGENPLVYEPTHPELKNYRDKNWEKLSFKDIPGIYPPLSLRFFQLGYLINPGGIWGQKFLILLGDICICVLIGLILKQAGKNSAFSLLYLWNPLVLKEFSNSAHVDSLALASCLAAIYFLNQRRHILPWLFFVFAISIKWIFILLLPVFIRKFSLRAILFGLLILAFIWYPFVDDFWVMTQGAISFGRHWLFNHSLYEIVYQITGGSGFLSMLWKLFMALLLGFTAVQFLIASDNLESRLKFSCNIFLILLCFSPVANSWYWIWPLVFSCVFPRYSLLVLTGLLCLSYSYYLALKDIPMFRLLEYAPFYILLFGEWRGKINFPLVAKIAGAPEKQGR